MIFDEVWFVERNYGIRQIVSKDTNQLIFGNLTKNLAHHIVDLHNQWLEKKEPPLMSRENPIFTGDAEIDEK